MTVNEYLQAVLDEQQLADDGPELEQLRAKREEVEKILTDAFGSGPTIKYGGSKAKNTMIKENFDLDIVCYFQHDDTQAGETLKDISDEVQKVLGKHFFVIAKTSALRLEDSAENGEYTHVDVVPGRFTDDTKTDAFLFQRGGEKSRLKTNIYVHIKHIRDSGLTDTIQLVKLWRERNGFDFKTFVLELLVVEVLSSHVEKSLDEQLNIFWKVLRDDLDELSIEDPANPTGNDLSDIFERAKQGLQFAAQTTLATIEATGWEDVFGEVGGSLSDAEKTAAISSIPRIKPQGTRPWAI